MDAVVIIDECEKLKTIASNAFFIIIEYIIFSFYVFYYLFKSFNFIIFIN